MLLVIQKFEKKIYETVSECFNYTSLILRKNQKQYVVKSTQIRLAKNQKLHHLGPKTGMWPNFMNYYTWTYLHN